MRRGFLVEAAADGPAIVLDAGLSQLVLPAASGVGAGHAGNGGAHDACSASSIIAIQLWGVSSPSMML